MPGTGSTKTDPCCWGDSEADDDNTGDRGPTVSSELGQLEPQLPGRVWGQAKALCEPQEQAGVAARLVSRVQLLIGLPCATGPRGRLVGEALNLPISHSMAAQYAAWPLAVDF